MSKKNNLADNNEILKKLEDEEKRVKKAVAGDAEDLKELQSDWQERDSPAERNLREVEWDQYSSLQDELKEINDAKLRLASGTFGICEECDKAISEKRLSFSPSARRCLKCQEQSEKAAGLAGRRASL